MLLPPPSSLQNRNNVFSKNILCKKIHVCAVDFIQNNDVPSWALMHDITQFVQLYYRNLRKTVKTDSPRTRAASSVLWTHLTTARRRARSVRMSALALAAITLQSKAGQLFLAGQGSFPLCPPPHCMASWQTPPTVPLLAALGGYCCDREYISMLTGLWPDC